MEFLDLLPGLATVALALFGGAGGSLLLEFWWRPRRAKRKVADLLLSELNVNLQMLVAHAHQRESNPRGIPGDFTLSKLAFEAIAPDLGELPPELAGKVIWCYHRFNYLMSVSGEYAVALELHRQAEAEGERILEQRTRQFDTTLDAFQLNVDSAFDDAATAFKELRKISKLKFEHEFSAEDFKRRVNKHLADREERLENLKNM